VIFGDDGGLVHALDARSGRPRWQLQTGGAVRARPAISNGSVFVQSDDGNLYKLNARTGRKEWSVRVMEKPFERPSMDDKKTRYENFASAVTISDGQLYLGTHDGHVLALDPADGSRRWDFAARDSVVSTPLAAGRRIYFGSFDGFVYALDAGSGALVWKYDTGSPVTSSPAFAGGRVIVGSRSYDLFALDAGTGRPAWERYSWFSWVESPATVFRGSVYIGSSDAAKVSALDALSGRRLWETDVLGDAWAQPAVTDRKVFMGSVGAVHYMVPLRATILAMDRRTGRPRWRFPTNPPPNPPAGTTSYGFASSPALGDGRVFFAGLDGRLRAFRQ